MPYRAPVQTLSSQERGVYAAFDYVNDVADYEKTVNRLTRLGSRALTFLGEVHLQESVNQSDDPTPFLDKANEAFSERVFATELGFDPGAAIRLAQIPLYRSQIVDKSFPGYDTLADSYQGVLTAAATAANHLVFSDDQNTHDNKESLGTISEATVLLMAIRYSLKNNLKDYWLPIQSLLRDDIGTQYHSKGKGWDISIFTPDQSDEPELSYKLKVKSSRKFLVPYSRDITVVGINPDLTIDGESGSNSVTILTDIQNEASPFKTSNSASKRLDLRTEKLLTALDRTK